MLNNQIHIASQQILKILGRKDVIVEFCWHSDEQVNVTPLTILTTGYRSEQPHISYAESLMQLGGIAAKNLYILFCCLHNAFIICAAKILQKIGTAKAISHYLSI